MAETPRKRVDTKPRYFLEGVSASAWTTKGEDWCLNVQREEGRLRFLKLDALKRSVFWLKSRIEDGSSDLRLMAEEVRYPEDEIEFDDAETAWAVIAEIGKAVQFLASTQDESWHEVPANLFDPPQRPIQIDNAVATDRA